MSCKCASVAFFQKCTRVLCVREGVCVFVALGFTSALFFLHLLCKALCATGYSYEKCYINEVRLIDNEADFLCPVGGAMVMTQW